MARVWQISKTVKRVATRSSKEACLVPWNIWKLNCSAKRKKNSVNGKNYHLESKPKTFTTNSCCQKRNLRNIRLQFFVFRAYVKIANTRVEKMLTVIFRIVIEVKFSRMLFQSCVHAFQKFFQRNTSRECFVLERRGFQWDIWWLLSTRKVIFWANLGLEYFGGQIGHWNVAGIEKNEP